MMRRLLRPLGAAVLVAGLVAVVFVAIETRPPLVSDPPSEGTDRAAALSAFLAETAPAEGTAPRGPWVLSLPQDHGSHPEAPAETWTISAALTTTDGARFDLFLSLLRYDVAGAEGGHGRAVTLGRRDALGGTDRPDPVCARTRPYRRALCADRRRGGP